jgi:hypothetical protein
MQETNNKQAASRATLLLGLLINLEKGITS